MTPVMWWLMAAPASYLLGSIRQTSCSLSCSQVLCSGVISAIFVQPSRRASNSSTPRRIVHRFPVTALRPMRIS